MSWILELILSGLSSKEVKELILKLARKWVESTENTWDDEVYVFLEKILTNSEKKK